MPDTSLLKNFNATCGGGLVLNKDVYDMQPGEAIQLVNFEPSTEGGYRRLNGTTKYNSTIVPQVALANERIQMSAIFNDKIIAARGGTVSYGGTSGSWTSIATSQGVNNTYDLGSTSFRWKNIYTTDLQLSNMEREVGNEVDGTRGNWTLQEGKDDLYIINRLNGKHYKINLQEVK